MTIQDLIFLRQARIAIDPADTVEVRSWENKKRDLGVCGECSALPSGQHESALRQSKRSLG